MATVGVNTWIPSAYRSTVVKMRQFSTYSGTPAHSIHHRCALESVQLFHLLSDGKLDVDAAGFGACLICRAAATVDDGCGCCVAMDANTYVDRGCRTTWSITWSMCHGPSTSSTATRPLPRETSLVRHPTRSVLVVRFGRSVGGGDLRTPPQKKKMGGGHRCPPKVSASYAHLCLWVTWTQKNTEV